MIHRRHSLGRRVAVFRLTLVVLDGLTVRCRSNVWVTACSNDGRISVFHSDLCKQKIGLARVAALRVMSENQLTTSRLSCVLVLANRRMREPIAQ
jgi:hypothetical protein